MNILFVDSITTQNYDFEYVKSNPIGGIESTVITIARELAKEHKVFISQVNRTVEYEENGVRYIHKNTALDNTKIQPDIIIIVRKYRLLNQYKQAHPDARLFTWVHNFHGYEYITRIRQIIKNDCTVICISRSLESHVNRIFNGPFSWPFRLILLAFKKVKTTTIYYPIDPAFIPGEQPYDKNKMLFFSAPYKGLKQSLEHFKVLLKKDPELKLFVTAGKESIKAYNLDADLINSNSVILLGRLSKNEIIRHLQSSLCVFYPQSDFAETFGRVYIEANCTGTPMLAHPFGSATEVMDNTEQFVDANNTNAVVEKILDWKTNGRPKVSCKEDFMMPKIIEKWKKILEF